MTLRPAAMIRIKSRLLSRHFRAKRQRFKLKKRRSV